MKDQSRLAKMLMAWVLVGAALSGQMQPAAAAMVSTSELLAAEQPQLAREQLAVALQRAEVRDLLTAYGISPADAAARAAQLTDAEVAQIEAHIQQLPAGGTDILGLLLVLFIVFVITDALGATDIFPFVHPINKK